MKRTGLTVIPVDDGTGPYGQMLVDIKALRKRLDVVYTQMQQRARPKLWKNGRRAGKVRVPGISSLPFTRQQLWDHVVAQLGFGDAACPYCIDIGRDTNMISLAACVLDHKVPVAHGGTWELTNLVAVCADCNNEKGKLSYAFVIGIMANVERWPDKRDRSNLRSCLRTHGVTQRMRGFYGKKGEKPQPLPSEPRLALAEDF